MTKRVFSLFILAAAVSGLAAAPAAAQSTEFTYQGRLLSGDVPANGAHDFEFILWDAESGGNQIGATVTLTQVNVQNGVFSVRIDFGNQFPGANRFLEIRVRPSGSGAAFTGLAPRQAISSAPYAIKSINAENAANATLLGGFDRTQFVRVIDSRLTDARPPLPNSPSYIQNTLSQQSGGNFNIGGSGTVGGTLSGNVVNATTQFSLGGERIVSTAGAFNLFVGHRVGESNTTGSHNSFFGRNAGAANTTGGNNSFIGSLAGSANINGGSNAFFGTSSGFRNTEGSANAFFGVAAGASNTTGQALTILGTSADSTDGLSNAAAIGYRAYVTQSNSLVLGSISGLNNALANTFVGIGTTAPTAKLSVAGNGAYNTPGAARFDLVNTAAGLGYLQHVDNNGLWQLATTAGQTKLVVNASGNVGIGVTAPAARAHIGGASSQITTPIAILHSSGNQTPLAFHSSNAEVARIRADSSGNLVLSTVSGANKDIYLRAGDDSNTDLFIDATTGNVGIGTTTPLSTLSVVGSISVTGRIALGNLDGSSTHLCYDTTTKEITSCSSSARYKTNINSLRLGLDLIRRLRPVSFTWKAKKSADFGLIAEEVAEVEPLLTFKNNRGEIEGVNYDGVGVVLVNAVNEQQQQIEAQRKQLDQQAETIRRQQAELDALKKLVCSQNPKADLCQPKQ